MYFFRISSDTTNLRLLFLRIRPRISSVFLRIRQFYDSYFFGYDAYFFRISSDTTSYFFGYNVYFRRISSITTILRLVFIPYILHTGILRLVFLPIPAVILQYYFVFENPTARIFSEEFEHAFGFRILGNLFSLVW